MWRAKPPLFAGRVTRRPDSPEFPSSLLFRVFAPPPRRPSSSYFLTHSFACIQEHSAMLNAAAPSSPRAGHPAAFSRNPQ
jgi:hypothetical protein